MSLPAARGGKKRTSKDARPTKVPPKVAPVKKRDDRSPLRERFLFIGMYLVGNLVEVEVKDGTVYVGVLHTINIIPNGLSVSLKLARPLAEEQSLQKSPPIENLLIPPSHFVRLAAHQVPPLPSTGFATDASIGLLSGKGQERELVAWVPDESIPLSLQGGLDGHEEWDQFSVNQQKFDVKTTWDENLYTTPLNVSDPNFKAKAAAAAKIAREIEGKTSSNAHIAEERGFEIDYGLDEEAKYSEVSRDGRPVSAPKGKPTETKNPPKHEGKSTPKAKAEPPKTDAKTPDAPKPAEVPKVAEATKAENPAPKTEPKSAPLKKLSAAAKEYVPRVAIPEPEPEVFEEEFDDYEYGAPADFYSNYYPPPYATPYYPPSPGYYPVSYLPPTYPYAGEAPPPDFSRESKPFKPSKPQ